MQIKIYDYSVPIFLALVLILSIQGMSHEINIDRSRKAISNNYRGRIINNTSKKITVSIFNDKGNVVHQQKLYPNFEINMSLSRGVYTFEFRDKYGNNLGFKDLYVDDSKVFYSDGGVYWFVEYNGSWNIGGNS